MDQGWEVAEEVQTVAGNMKGAIDHSVKDQPMATLAVAVLQVCYAIPASASHFGSDDQGKFT